MNRFALCAILVLIWAVALPASAGDEIRFGGHGGIHYGGLYWDVSGINDFLEPANMDTLPTVLPALGGGGQAIIFGGVILGARGSVSQYHLGGRDMAVDVGVSYGFLDLGYAVINTKRWLLTPVAGLGGSSVRLEMDGDLSSVDLQQYASDYDSRQPEAAIEDKVTLSTSSAIGHLGLAAYHQIRFAETEGGGFANFLIGVSSGWIFEVSHAGWQIDGDEVRNGPIYSPHGGYVQLELHFGGGTRMADRKAESRKDEAPPAPLKHLDEKTTEAPPLMIDEKKDESEKAPTDGDTQPKEKPEGR